MLESKGQIDFKPMLLPVIFTIIAAVFYYEDSGWTLTPDINMTLFWSAVFACLALYSYVKLRHLR